MARSRLVTCAQATDWGGSNGFTANVTITNIAWNATIAPNASVPTGFTINGTTCT